MKNPLKKRLLRELTGEWRKYVALFLLMVLMIGASSAMFVANDSMESELSEAYEKYHIEDGHFELRDEGTDRLLSLFEDEGIQIYEQYYQDFDEDFDLDGVKDADLRVFTGREEVNGICVMEGTLPKTDTEIAIDRMHADNHGITVGSVILLDDTRMTVSGLVAFSDYSTLYKNPADTMFDALTFNIGIVTKEAFEALEGKLTYQYAFTYNDRPESTAEKKDRAETLAEQLAVLSATGGMFDEEDAAKAFEENVEELTEQLTDPEISMERAAEILDSLNGYQADWDEGEADRNELTLFVPEYLNQAIHFAPSDMGSDKAMIEVLMVVLIIVLAFIFSITTSNTITNEASAIGTLRASGYTRGELLRHYIAIPVIVTVIAAAVGNILGYSCLKNVVVYMYYNSYSLPTYTTRWNADAFLRTTLLPLIIVFLVNLVVLLSKLRFSPLKFLRHDLSNSRRKRAVKLPDWPFMSRFRMRILLQNIPGYLVLFLGIFFVDVLLGFSFALPETLHNYQAHATDYMLVNYQYVLTASEDADGDPVTTAEPTAEKYSVTTLEEMRLPHIGEKITVYGAVPGSRYLPDTKELAPGEVYVTDDYAEKFSLEPGDQITLKEEYTDVTYDFTVAGRFTFTGTIGLVMPQDAFNQVFSLEEDAFTGYLSENEIKDIDKDLIATSITFEDVTKIADQLDHSMGSYMYYVAVVSTVMAMLILYLLTKTIIEHNAVSISMVKVLGYENREINSLYIRITSGVVVVSAIIGSFLCKSVLVNMWKSVMSELNGWFAFVMTPATFLKIILLTVLAYLVVMYFDMRRIRRIPLTEALKNVE